MLQEMTGKEESLLYEHLKRHLVRQSGKLRLDYLQNHKWAVLWWDKDDPATMHDSDSICG
jgi:hypothetical protein